jgi:LacI family transcriptional regulator
MRRLLECEQQPTAVLVASVNASIGALSAALAASIDVPRQLSIVTIHDTWQAAFVTPPITTVALPMHAAGSLAASMLLEHLSGAPLRDDVISHPAARLVTRDSTAPPRSS